MRMPRPIFLPVLLLAVAGLLLAACGDGQTTHEFEDVRDRSKPRHDVPEGMTAAERLGFKKSGGAHPHGGMDMGGMGHGASKGPEFTWKTPEGWREVKVGTMRAASWEVEKVPTTDCSLTVLPSGGDPLMNVNRWRKEMGLGPIDAAALKDLPRTKLLGASAIYVDLSGDYSGGASGRGAVKGGRLLGVILPAPTSQLFVKFTGPAKGIAAEKTHFEDLVASIQIKKPAGGMAGHGGMAGPGGGPARGPTTWTTPEGWTEQPKKMMRIVTLVPDDLPSAWCYASVVGGGMMPNLNRWRAEMGVPRLSEQEIAKLEKVPVMGRDAVFIDVTGKFRGTGGPPMDDARMYGLVCPLGGQDLFIKMVGPKDKLESQKAKFIEFCKSMK